MVNRSIVDWLYAHTYPWFDIPGGIMKDGIVWLWNASPVNPIEAAIILWIVWKLYSYVGLKVFVVIVAGIAAAAIFWNAERVPQILTWLGAAYIALRLFGVIGEGEGLSSSLFPKTPKEEGPRIPHGAPPGYNPYIQQPGSHPHGYNPDHDPANQR